MGGTVSFTWSENGFEAVLKANRATETNVKLPKLFDSYTIEINGANTRVCHKSELYKMVVKAGVVVTVKACL